MSVRAYLSHVVTDKDPLFSVWGDEKVMEEIEKVSTGVTDVDGGLVEVRIDDLRNILEQFKPESLPLLDEFMEKYNYEEEDYVYLMLY